MATMSDSELGITVDSVVSSGRLQKFSSSSSSSSLSCRNEEEYDPIVVFVVSCDVREEILLDPGETVRALVDRFREKSGGVFDNEEFVVMTNEHKVLDNDYTLLEAGVQSGETLLLQSVELKDQAKAATKPFPWHIITLTCGLLCLVTLVASITAWSYSYGPPDRYLVLLDAGSVHTSVYTYRYSYTEPDSPVSVSESHFCDLGQTGISSFKEDPASASSFISTHPCVRSSIERVPSVSRPFSNILLGSTAGMRVLNLSVPETTRQILDNLTDSLETVSLGMKSGAKILSGEEEGIDGWVTANYLEGSLGIGTEDTMGALDWGGASSQITRILDNSKEVTSRIALYGQEYDLFARSHLCYGQAEALKRHKALLVYRLYKELGNFTMNVPDPCLPQGAVVMPLPITKLYSSPCTHMVDTEFMDMIKQSPNNVTFIPKQNLTQCNSVVADLFSVNTCQELFVPQLGETTCLDPSTIPPPGQMKYLAFSTYWYLTSGVGLQSKFSLAEFEEMTNKLCQATTDSELLVSLGPVADIACFQATFMTHLLTRAYHFDSSNWKQISFVKRIADAEVGWGLGYAIAQANSLAPTEGWQLISFPLLLVLVSISGLLLLLGVGGALQVILKRRDYTRLQDSA